MINVVTDFGAFNDGIGSNYNPFMQAIQQAISDGGNEIYFPPGVYKIKGNAATAKPIYKSGANNIKMYGKGATIICDTDIDEPGINGNGGGFALYGNNIEFEDIEIEGQSASIGSTNYGYGRLIRISGDYATIKNCRFKYGNGGAIEIAGNYHVINSNYFDSCNNHPLTGADYGSIQISSVSRYITITNNSIVNQFYSGICAYGSTALNISHLNICSNYIRSNSSSGTTNHSMGIFLLNGANRNILISNNIIEKIDAEGIMLTSGTDFSAENCIISGNIISDCDYRGIALSSLDTGGTFHNITISNNHIRNSSAAPNCDHQVWVEQLSDSIITGNTCQGYPTQTLSMKGIAFNGSCPRNTVNNNNISYCQTGITFFSANGILANNLVSECDNGLQIGYCRGANVHGNVIKSCQVGITTITDATFQITGNSILDCANKFNTSGTVIPEVLTQTGYATSTAASGFVVKGTLSAGAAAITYYNVFSEDKFMVIPINQTADVQAIVYISSVNPATNTIQVRSTLTTDTRSFMVVKIFSGG